MKTVKGRVFKRGKTWYYEVRVGTKRVFADNTGSWRPVFDGCHFDVAVARRVVGAGHDFAKSYDELVGELAR